MDSAVTLELSRSQKDLILEGLRFVRSSRKLGFRDPLAAPDEQREHDITTVQNLISRINELDSGKSV